MSENKLIKSYVLRAGRMSDSQRLAYKTLKDVHCIPYEEKQLDLSRIFPGIDNYYLEIGFGMGDVTHIIAENNRKNGYIGCNGMGAKTDDKECFPADTKFSLIWCKGYYKNGQR